MSSMHEEVPPVLTAAINELAQGQCAAARVEERIEAARDRLQRYLVELGDSVRVKRQATHPGHDRAWFVRGQTYEARDLPQPQTIADARMQYVRGLEHQTVEDYVERHGEEPPVAGLFYRRQFRETADTLVDYITRECGRLEPEEAIANYMRGYLGPRYSHLESDEWPQVGEEITAACADFRNALVEGLDIAGRASVDAEIRRLRRSGSSRIPPINAADVAQDDVMRRFAAIIMPCAARFLARLYVHYVPTAFDCVDTSLPEEERDITGAVAP